MRSRQWWAIALLAAMGLVSASVSACKRSHASVASDPVEPTVAVRAETEGLLLTWIDDKGDFHVETRVADVPIMGRDTVRVVDPGKDEGARGDRVDIVDLRESRADGTYPVRKMQRADFEALAVARRERTGPTLASAAPPTPSPDPIATGSQPTPANPPARAMVVIYGAEWCGACHDAARYMRHKGIAYVEKDVEKDPTAAREMQDKLAKSGLRAGSIPVIDVRGNVMVGFNPAEVDAALGATM